MIPPILTIAASDALAHDLPPVTLTLDVSRSRMMVTALPGPGTYVTMSGPPGGPLYFHVVLATGPDGIEERVQNEALKTYKDAVLGPKGVLEIGGVRRDAVLFFGGRQNASSVGCGALVPVGEASLLVVFGHGIHDRSTVSDCATVARHPSFEHLLATFKAEWHPDAVKSAPRKVEVQKPEERAAAAAPEPTATEPVVEEPAPPAEAPGAAGARVLGLVNRVKETMRRTGVWSNEMPTAESYAAWGDYERQMWSLQSTLDAIVPSLAAMQGTEGADGMGEGVSGLLASVRDQVRHDPKATELVVILDQGLGA